MNVARRVDEKTNGERAFRRLLALGLTWALLLPPVSAQQARPPSLPRDRWAADDLAAQNSGRVAASAVRIAAVLRKDAGLMVELKRWVAKEATDQGQIVEDGDLTDSAIYARLEDDVEFRSVATRLLQRYGYLLPQFNPESDAAKEREVLIQERVKRMLRTEAEEEEEARRRLRELREGTLDRANATDEGREVVSRQPRRPRFAPETKDVPVTPLPRDRQSPQMPEQRLTDALQIASTLPADSLTPAVVRKAAGEPSWPAAAGQSAEFPDELSAQERLGRALQREGQTEEFLSDGNGRHREVASYAGSEPRDGGSGLTFPRSREPEATFLVRRPNPYADIPSLYDLYVQAPQRPAELERFGLDVFRNSSLSPDVLPMDLPVGPDYVVGPGDALTIDMWGGVTARLMRTVDSEGRVALPEVGPVLVSGHTMGEVQRTLQSTLRSQFRDISADVSLARLRSVRVYVVGDVEKPGAYEVSSLSTPLAALFQAGGPTENGSARTVRHYRGKQLVQEVDVYDLLLRGVRSDVMQLRDGDTVMVPPIGPQVKVEGMVRRPAVYELRGETPLDEVLQLAGGILPTATLRHIQVQRLEAHERRTMISVDLPESDDSEAVGKQLHTFPLRDGDEIRIYPIAQHNRDAVYLLGHALRPGRYSYREGMRVTDLIASYQDLLPEPAARYAEIIRLNAPDYRPSVESFDLGTALASPANAPVLKPMDTVRVFSRYDFEEPPTVWVGGEVFHPGTYRTSGQIHLRDAVHLAGGLTPDAKLDSAQVFRNLPGGEMKIFSVTLSEALAGNPIDNVLLLPRDRVLIHRSLAKVDPATVYIKGEVAKPGRYPLTTNMRISDLIGVAGGLKRGAFTGTADLTRFPLAAGEAASARQEISLATALAGNPESDIPLRDGDTLSIRQIPGWKDIGASITLSGEVVHPGTYGIEPGERLSSVLRRAGGFRATAYPRGALLERETVRRLNEQNREDLIRRVDAEITKIEADLRAAPPEQKAEMQAGLLQRQRILEKLREAPLSGRLVVRLQNDLVKFASSPDDIEVRDGDQLTVPKPPTYVLVLGQVYNPNAITYLPRKNAGWYLERAGGPTKMAEKKDIFLIRANGMVESAGQSWWGGGVLSTRIEPGDTIVVPEKPIGNSKFWSNFAALAQVASSVGVALAVTFRR